jgi:hypothetical protein
MSKSGGIITFLSELTNDEIIEAYSLILQVMKDRKIIRTNNLIGDLAESLAISHFNKTELLPNLKQSITNKKDYDAIDDSNVRYAIKSTSTIKTGTFWGLSPLGTPQVNKVFDILLIVKFSKTYQMTHIYSIDWETFLNFKEWSSTQNAWFINLKSSVKNTAKLVFRLPIN